MFSGNSTVYTRCYTLLLAGMLLVCLGGCGSSDPFDTVPVSGKVTFEDGSSVPADGMSLVFSAQVESVDSRTHARPGQAAINVADGTFSEATTNKVGDGLILGKHTVKAFAYDKDLNEVPLTIDPTEIEVSPDSTVFEFRVKK